MSYLSISHECPNKWKTSPFSLAISKVALAKLNQEVTPYYGILARDMAVEAGFMDRDQISGDYFEGSVLNMPHFPKSAIRRFSRCFSLYVKFPESRWDEISQAETDDELLGKLQGEHRRTFFGEVD